MRLDELNGRRVVLLGLGTDVLAAVPAIEAAGPAQLVAVEDGDLSGGPGASLRRMGVVEAATDGEVFVRSPGFPRYLAPLVAARERGARMTTPIDLWMGTVGPSRTVVAITGTKGKSTVTELVGVLARAAGLHIGVAGNLGVAVFDHGWEHDAPVVVLEVSSYQAADLHHVPDVAVLTFLSEDHLSWHGGVATYVADKLRVLHNEAGTAGRILLPATGGDAGEAVAALGLGRDLERGIEVVEPPVADASVPRHRLQNAALAAAVLAGIGGPTLSGNEVVEAARSSLPGRLDPCDGPAGLLCVDDALASNPSAAAAGLGWLRMLGRPTAVLLGGADRGVDPSPLVEEAARWPPGSLRAVALPVNGADLARRAGIAIVASAVDVDDAVRAAVADLPADGAVILSPAAPTPPAVGNWETRSNQFRSALASLTARG